MKMKKESNINKNKSHDFDRTNMDHPNVMRFEDLNLNQRLTVKKFVGRIKKLVDTDWAQKIRAKALDKAGVPHFIEVSLSDRSRGKEVVSMILEAADHIRNAAKVLNVPESEFTSFFDHSLSDHEVNAHTISFLNREQAPLKIGDQCGHTNDNRFRLLIVELSDNRVINVGTTKLICEPNSFACRNLEDNGDLSEELYVIEGDKLFALP